MEPKDRTKEVTFDDEAHLRLAQGVEIMRKAVGRTYGPGGRPVLVGKKYVHPVLTRDGVTVARDIAGYGNKIADPVAREAAKLMYQASEKTNKTAGDGTTVTVIELAALYEGGRKRIAAGEDAMVLKRALDHDRDLVLDFVQSQSIECDKDKLDQVATISCGDEALGHLISDLVYDVGADGTITISYQNAPNVKVEKVTGYLFDQGCKFLVTEVELEKPWVFVTQKRMSTKTDIVPILEASARAGKQFVIIGDVAGAAMDTLIWAVQNQKADGVAIPPPAFGADGQDYFEDIATYVGSKVFLEGDDFSMLMPDPNTGQFNGDYYGTIRRARLSREKAILFGDNKTGDEISNRISKIKKLLDGEVSPSLKEQLEQRYAKLAGKVSIIRVGADTDVAREELFFRVEDAVEACKSALSSGIVAGGATTLLFASSLRKEQGKIQVSALETFVQEALQQPFRLLMANTGEDGGYRLNQVLNAGYGKGFNLRDMSETPVDLFESGVVDATKVITQAVKNAFSVAGSLLTIGAIITEVEDEMDKPTQTTQA